jgi:hypothetical protein
MLLRSMRITAITADRSCGPQPQETKPQETKPQRASNRHSPSLKKGASVGAAGAGVLSIQLRSVRITAITADRSCGPQPQETKPQEMKPQRASNLHSPPLKKGADSAQRWRGDLLLKPAATRQASASDFRPTSFAAMMPASYSRHIGIASSSCEITSGGVMIAATMKMPTIA